MRRSYRAYTKAFKQRIYLAAQSPATDGAELDWIGSVLARHAIDARRCDSLLAAERFSITNYVHPPLALADTTLKAIFQPQTPVQYLYKTYPEGPLCPEVIADMLELSEDYKGCSTISASKRSTCCAFERRQLPGSLPHGQPPLD